MKMYAIYDQKAESYNMPFAISTDGLARRAFEDACKDPRTDLSRYPGDFSLYNIGLWSETTGEFENVVPPKFIARNNEVVPATSEGLEKSIEKTEKEIESIEKEVKDE